MIGSLQLLSSLKSKEIPKMYCFNCFALTAFLSAVFCLLKIIFQECYVRIPVRSPLQSSV